MPAYSVTGTGNGAANRPSIVSMQSGPSLIFAGQTLSGDNDPPSSPPGNLFYTVTFPYALRGGADSYVVLLTTIGGGSAQVAEKIEDDAGNFTGFLAVSETVGTLMYLVTSAGSRPESV